MDDTAEKEATVDLIFRQYICNAVLMIADSVDHQFLLKEYGSANIIDVIEKTYQDLKKPYESWFDGMKECSFQEITNIFKNIAKKNIETIKREKGEDLRTIFSIINYMIQNGLHSEILKSYNLTENVTFDINANNFTITAETLASPEVNVNDLPILTAEEVIQELSNPSTPNETYKETNPSSSSETILESPLKNNIIDEITVSEIEPSRKRKHSTENFPPQKRILKSPFIKAFIAFKYDKNPLIGVKSYSLASFQEYVIDEPCCQNWQEKLCKQLKDADISHLYVQGKSQARYLREYVPDIYIIPLPQRDKGKVCEDCKTFSCSVGKLKNYMKDFHNFTFPMECR